MVLPFLGIAKSIVLVPILLSSLGEYSYGIYVLVATGLGYALIISGFGLDSAMYRFVPARLGDDNGRSIRSACLLLAMISGGVVLLVGGVAFWIEPLSEEMRHLPLLVGCICFIQALWSVCFAYERSRDRLIWLVKASAIFNLLEFVVLAATAYYLRDITSMFIGMLVLNTVWACVIFLRQTRGISLSMPKWQEISAISAFGGHSVVNTLVVGAFLTIDKFVLGFTTGPATLAFYAPAAGLAMILGSLASISLFSIPHLLAEAHDQSRADDTRLIMRHGLNVYLYIAFPALLGLCVTVEPILTLLIGESLAAKGGPIAIIFSVALFILGVQRFPSQELRVRGQSSWISFVAGISLAGYVAAISVAIVAGWTLAIAIPLIYLVITIVQTGWILRKTALSWGFKISLPDAVPPVLAGTFCIVPGFALDLMHWPVLAGYIVATVCAYFSFLALWRRAQPLRFSYLR